MNKKIKLDAAILSVFVVMFFVVLVQWLYEGHYADIFPWILGAIVISAAILAYDLSAVYSKGKPVNMKKSDDKITEICLLNEEFEKIQSWDLFGRISMVIGRDVKENHVDINLGGSEYGAMIEVEHAVLNYSGGFWYIEDVGSKNGLVIKKASDGIKYKLAKDQPCKLDVNDVIYLGMTKLKVD